MIIGRCLKRKTGAVLLVAGLAAGVTVAVSGTADAAGCSGLTGLAGSCTTTGTLNLTAGTLQVGAPGSLTWTATLNGQAQTVYDANAADDVLYASDLRGILSGAGSGWNITATATVFTSGTNTIPDTLGKVLGFGGGSTSATATAVPSASCYYAGCVNANPGLTTYPIFVPTGSATPTKIYNAQALSGAGVIQVGAASPSNPAVWSLAVPATLAYSSTIPYTSTITVTIASGPLRIAAADRFGGGPRLRRPGNRSAVARKRGGTR
jgi:hypothetical protein